MSSFELADDDIFYYINMSKISSQLIMRINFQEQGV